MATDFPYDVFLSRRSKDKAVVRPLAEPRISARSGRACVAVTCGRRRADGLSRMGTSGLDFDNVPEDQKCVINNLPAMLYHGVNSEAAVLMRMNAVPRSIAVGLGEKYAATAGKSADLHSVRSAQAYLRTLSPTDWQRSAPSNAKMTGEDYRDIWSLLAGEHRGQRTGIG